MPARPEDSTIESKMNTNENSECIFPLVYCDKASKNAKRVFSEFQPTFPKSPLDADLLWMRKGYKPFMDKLLEFQLLNHLPNEREIVVKNLLTENLQRYNEIQSKFDFPLNYFYQDSYCLHDSAHCNSFFSQKPSQPDKNDLWILKPGNLSSGRDIQIIWDRDEARPLAEGSRRPDGSLKQKQYIAQRYIKNPLLLEGRKSEIRIYWLIASLDPLLVLIFKEGTVRLNSLPFKLDDFENQLIHVTNVFQQEHHPDFDPNVVLKWSFADLDSYVTKDLGLTSPGFIKNRLMPKLKKYLAFVVDSALKELRNVPRRGLFFGLYGADIILDDRLHPWLTEIQKGPGLSLSDPVKQRVIPPMLKETVSIMHEIQRRRRNGESLKNLESISGFELVTSEVDDIEG